MRRRARGRRVAAAQRLARCDADCGGEEIHRAARGTLLGRPQGHGETTLQPAERCDAASPSPSTPPPTRARGACLLSDRPILHQATATPTSLPNLLQPPPPPPLLQSLLQPPLPTLIHGYLPALPLTHLHLFPRLCPGIRGYLIRSVDIGFSGCSVVLHPC
ncbi:hypothetical protein ACP70R_041627 [Stipagrostis hirtigluma subsp. patula]